MTATTVQVESRGDAAILRIGGDVTAASDGAFSEAYASATDGGARALVLDFSGMEACCSDESGPYGEGHCKEGIPAELEPFLEQYVSKWQVYAGPRYPIEPALARDHATRLFERGTHSAGRDRQLAAILASGSRRKTLASITCPALVIHGDSDPVVRIEAGMATANAIEGAELLVFEGMGHDLAKGLWPQVVDAIARHAGR